MIFGGQPICTSNGSSFLYHLGTCTSATMQGSRHGCVCEAHQDAKQWWGGSELKGGEGSGTGEREKKRGKGPGGAKERSSEHMGGCFTQAKPEETVPDSV